MPTKTKKTAKKAAKKATKKAAAKKSALKKTAVKKKAAKKATKKATKKTTKKAVAAPKASRKKTAPKTPKASREKTAPKTAPKTAEVSRTDTASEKKSSKIVFSLDDVEELVASKKAESPTKKALKPVKKAAKKTIAEDKPVEKRVLGPASLGDILGFNPAEKKKKTELGEKEVPKKWKKYYNLLIKLREHVSDEISLHTADTLKHSSREDSGDISGYGNHQADAGTDTFDRDFALSLVSNEQDALNEIEEAIMRIKDGSYGVCEVTGKAIPAARLTAVPFARFSVEGQIDHEKNQRHRKHDRSVAGGIFGDVSDAPKIDTGEDE
ncbi:MAG: TraR/DksA C4-type zinc finger protein [Opitutales bacterium]